MMDWIRSAGGPLICLEERLARSWGGVFRLTVPHPIAPSDYERACDAEEYVRIVPLTAGTAVAFGGGPMDTSVWHSPAGYLFVVQPLYSAVDVDENQKLAQLDESILLDPLELSEWQVDSSPLVLFDSAEPGDAPDKKIVTFDITPGRYQIRTQHFEPDEETFFVLHRFDPLA